MKLQNHCNFDDITTASYALRADDCSASWFSWEHCSAVHQYMVIQPSVKGIG